MFNNSIWFELTEKKKKRMKKFLLVTWEANLFILLSYFKALLRLHLHLCSKPHLRYHFVNNSQQFLSPSTSSSVRVVGKAHLLSKNRNEKHPTIELVGGWRAVEEEDQLVLVREMAANLLLLQIFLAKQISHVRLRLLRWWQGEAKETHSFMLV